MFERGLKNIKLFAIHKIAKKSNAKFVLHVSSAKYLIYLLCGNLDQLRIPKVIKMNGVFQRTIFGICICLLSEYSLSGRECGYVNGELVYNELAGRSCEEAMAAARAASQGNAYESTNNSASPSRRSSSGLSEEETYQIIQQTGEIVTEIIESNERDRIENERRLEEQLRIENEKRIADERQQAIEKERAQRDKADRLNKYQNALGDSANNPWNGDSPSFKKGGNSPQSEDPASNPPQKAKPKDPQLDYAGKPCEYFTRPSDEAHLNYHRDGATVAYGNNIYVCDEGRWRFRTTVDKYWAPVRNIEASRLEN